MPPALEDRDISTAERNRRLGAVKRWPRVTRPACRPQGSRERLTPSAYEPGPGRTNSASPRPAPAPASVSCRAACTTPCAGPICAPLSRGLAEQEFAFVRCSSARRPRRAFGKGRGRASAPSASKGRRPGGPGARSSALLLVASRRTSTASRRASHRRSLRVSELRRSEPAARHREMPRQRQQAFRAQPPFASTRNQCVHLRARGDSPLSERKGDSPRRLSLYDEPNSSSVGPPGSQHRTSASRSRNTLRDALASARNSRM